MTITITVQLVLLIVAAFLSVRALSRSYYQAPQPYLGRDHSWALVLILVYLLIPHVVVWLR